MRTIVFLFILGLLYSFTAKALVLTSNNHITFFGYVDEVTVGQVQREFIIADQLLPKSETIYLVLNTPGGELFQGKRLIDFIKATKRPVNVLCLYCASMGFNFLQAFNKRLAIHGSYIMMHPATTTISGTIPYQFVSRLEAVLSMINYYDVTNSKRMGISVEKYQVMINDELNTSAEQGLKVKAIDEIVEVTCSKDLLNGTKFFEYTDNSNYCDQKKIRVKRSACPLIQGDLSKEEFKVEGKRNEK